MHRSARTIVRWLEGDTGMILKFIHVPGFSFLHLALFLLRGVNGCDPILPLLKTTSGWIVLLQGNVNSGCPSILGAWVLKQISLADALKTS